MSYRSYLHLGMLDNELNEHWRDEQLYTIVGYVFRHLFQESILSRHEMAINY